MWANVLRLFLFIRGMVQFTRLLFNRNLALVLCGLPVVLYALFFQQIVLNVNYFAYDDLHVLQVVEQWQKAANWQEKLDWLTVGFPEHRIVFTRSVVLLFYAITGSVKLTNLMVVSNLLWIGQLAILYLVFRRLRLALLYFVPFCWLLLNVHSFENIFWGTSSLGNFGLLFFIMLGAYFYSHNAEKNIGWALLFSTIATFTYGNGLMAFLTGSLLLTLTQQWKLLKTTVGAMIVVLMLYSLTRAHASPGSLDLTNPNSYWLAFTCFFAFLGSSVNFNPYAPSSVEMGLSVGFGIVLVAAVLWLLRAAWLPLFAKKWPDLQRFTPAQQFALILFLFVCLSALGVVYKRSGGDGLVGMFKGRYRMYPTWLLITTYLLLLTHIRQSQKLVSLAVMGSIAFNLLILYHCVAPAVNNRRMALAQEFNSVYNADLLGLKMFEIPQTEFLRLQSLYRPNLFFQESKTQLNTTADSLVSAGKWPLDSVYWQGDNLLISWQKDFIAAEKDFDDGAYILLKSATHLYMAAGLQQTVPLSTFVRRGYYWNRGFVAIFNRPSTAAGTYRMYVLQRKNGVNRIYDTSRQITLKR